MLEKWNDLWFDCVMDSLTQLLLGAGVGYVIAGRQLGRRALALGAFAGTLPDLDSIPLSLFNDDYLMLKHHRGITHSLVFVCSFRLSWRMDRVYIQNYVRFLVITGFIFGVF